MARHFLGLRGARTVATEHLRLTHHAAADVWAACAMGAVHGPAGLGKTVAVEDALASRRRGEVCWASFPSRPTMRLVSVELWATLSGEPAPRADRFALTARLVEELSTCRRMLVVDEAQRLIYRRVAFGAMTARQVLEVVRRFHPLYQDATDELVLFVDDNFGHGNFRNWAAFTRTAQSLCTRGRRGFDEDVARNAFLLHGGGKDAA